MATESESISIPEEMPVLPLMDVVVFPFIIMPLSVSRESSIAAVDAALEKQRIVFLSLQKDPATLQPSKDDIHSFGTIAVINRMLRLPDGRVRILIQGLARGTIRKFVKTKPYFRAAINPIDESPAQTTDLSHQALIMAIRNTIEKLEAFGKEIPAEVRTIIKNLEDGGRLADLTVSNLSVDSSEAQRLLETMDVGERLRRTHDILVREVKVFEMKQEISSAAQDEIKKVERDRLLRSQIKAIQSVLGEGDDIEDEVDTYHLRIEQQLVPHEAEGEIEKQIRRLRQMPPDSPEVATIRSHLEWLTTLPWSAMSVDSHDLERAAKLLDEEHYGLDEIKERIIEFLAVRKLRGETMRGQTLCLAGPPGVGKTSLGRAIARALDRKFIRISLGGVRDETQIRGQRRTTAGAMPGLIVQALRQAGTSNPVVMLDEVDKLNADSRGDPASALLEVFDPEQNHAFVDQYLGIPYDLSRVLFIATANDLQPIGPALLDRMDVIEISGYTDEEKLEIARRHLIPRQIEENGIERADVRWEPPGLMHLIQTYTNEPGLRKLERVIASICRRIALHEAEGKRVPHCLTADSIASYLRSPVRM